MPNPIPLVEPVTNDTLPASGCWTLRLSALRGMFMAGELLLSV
jgi:hypothetical protein